MLTFLFACAVLSVSILLPKNVFEEKTKNTAEVISSVVTTYTNSTRKEAGLPLLVEDPLLARAALLKAQDMAKKGYFAHISPSGERPWYWLDAVGYQYDYAGENLALHFSNSQEVVAGWKASPAHYANIIKKEYTHVGTGVATGTYDGVESVFVVQFYARTFAQNKKTMGASILQPLLSETSLSDSTFATALYTPRSITHAFAYSVLVGLLTLSFVAYMLAVFVHIRIQNRSVLLHGAVLLVALCALVLTEMYVVAPRATEASFVEFTAE